MGKINFWLRVNNFSLNVKKTQALRIRIGHLDTSPINEKIHLCGVPEIMSDRTELLQQDECNLSESNPIDSFFSLASSKIIYWMNCDCPIANEVDRYKYFGMTFESDLKFKTHIKNLMVKLRLWCILLSRLKNVTSIEFRKKVYYAFIHSQLKYVILVYGANFATLTNVIIRFQKHSTPILWNLYRCSCTARGYKKDNHW